MIDSIKTHIKKVHHSETLLTNELSKQLETEGKQVFKFGFGQSPFLPPEWAIESLKKYADRKEYVSVQGLTELRQAAADFHNEMSGSNFTADQVLVGPGSKM